MLWVWSEFALSPLGLNFLYLPPINYKVDKVIILARSYLEVKGYFFGGFSQSSVGTSAHHTKRHSTSRASPRSSEHKHSRSKHGCDCKTVVSTKLSPKLFCYYLAACEYSHLSSFALLAGEPVFGVYYPPGGGTPSYSLYWDVLLHRV